MHGPLPKEVKRSGTADGLGGTHFADIHMLSDTEIDFTKKNYSWPPNDVKDSKAEEDSGVFTRSPFGSHRPALLNVASDCVQSAANDSPDKTSEETAARPYGNITGHDSLFKRKPQGEVGSWHRKKRCVATGQREQQS